MKSLQELADEAFADLLKKHRRPVTLKQALKESLRRQPANDPAPSARSERSTLGRGALRATAWRVVSDATMGHDHEHDLRSYGRRRGRKPSPRQAALLGRACCRAVALDLSRPAAGAAGRAVRAARRARSGWRSASAAASTCSGRRRHNPSVGLIGCEPFQDGVVKVLSAIEEEQLANIRLHADDARPLLRWLPEASIGRAFILFPDPWPKKRHQKRRLVSAATLARACPRHARRRRAAHRHRHRRLRALDAAGRCRTTEFPLDGRRAPPTGASGPPIGRRPATSRRPCKEGRRCYYFRFRRG